MTNLSENIEQLISRVIQNPQRCLCVYANEDISCEKDFFMRRNSRLLLDGIQLTAGIHQFGGLGMIHPPYGEWHTSGKIDLSLLDIDVEQVGVSFVEFLKNHYSDRPLVGAELGVYYGDNAIRMLENLNIKTLYLIDPYEDNPEFQPENHDLFRHVREVACERMAPYHSSIKWIYKKSMDAIHEIEELLDFCYVDSCHNRAVVSAELPIYYEIVKKNGVFGGHDYANRDRDGLGVRNVEVHSCVDEFVIDNHISPFYYSYKALQWFIVKERVYPDSKLMTIVENRSRSGIGIGTVYIAPGQQQELTDAEMKNVGVVQFLRTGILTIVRHTISQ